MNKHGCVIGNRIVWPWCNISGYKYAQDYNKQKVIKSFTDKTSDGLVLERLPDEGSDFKIGQYVRHEVFGRGQILGVESTRLGTKLVVQFENVSIKKLIAEYANLTISDSLEK